MTRISFADDFISEANLCEGEWRVKVSKAVERGNSCASRLALRSSCGTESANSNGLLVGEKINECRSDDCTGCNRERHPDRQADSVAPETLIVILDCVFSEEGGVLVSEGRSFGPGPRIVVRRDLDDVAGHR